MARPEAPVSIDAMFDRIEDFWSPKIIAEANGWHVKLVKAEGKFVWHTHADVDEIFLLVSGRLTIHLPDREVTLLPGDVFVVPHGVQHQPDAGPGCEMMLLEPAGVPNTGDVVGELSAEDEWLEVQPLGGS